MKVDKIMFEVDVPSCLFVITNKDNFVVQQWSNRMIWDLDNINKIVAGGMLCVISPYHSIMIQNARHQGLILSQNLYLKMIHSSDMYQTKHTRTSCELHTPPLYTRKLQIFMSFRLV